MVVCIIQSTHPILPLLINNSTWRERHVLYFSGQRLATVDLVFGTIVDADKGGLAAIALLFAGKDRCPALCEAIAQLTADKALLRPPLTTIALLGAGGCQRGGGQRGGGEDGNGGEDVKNHFFHLYLPFLPNTYVGSMSSIPNNDILSSVKKDYTTHQVTLNYK